MLNLVKPEIKWYKIVRRLCSCNLPSGELITTFKNQHLKFFFFNNNSEVEGRKLTHNFRAYDCYFFSFIKQQYIYQSSYHILSLYIAVSQGLMENSLLLIFSSLKLMSTSLKRIGNICLIPVKKHFLS